MSHAAATPAMAAPDRRLPMLRLIAWLCTGMMLVTLTLSAFMRLSQAGLGCADWPACYGQNLRAAQQGEPVPTGHLVAAARLAHRVFASLTLVLVIMLVMSTLATPAISSSAWAVDPGKRSRVNAANNVAPASENLCMVEAFPADGRSEWLLALS